MKYLCDLGVYEKVDERAGIAQITPVDTKWIDTITIFDEDPCKSDHE